MNVAPDAGPGDRIVSLAKAAEAELCKVSCEGGFDAVDTGLEKALEAARVFRMQLDVHGDVTVDRLLAIEALYRSAIGLQPALADAEIEGLLRELDREGRQVPENDERERAGKLRESAFVVARSLLESLNVAYRVAFGVEVMPWRSA